MRSRSRFLSIALLTAVGAACAGEAPQEEMDTPAAEAEAPAAETETAAGPAEWSYEGETGPESWGQLSADYALCAEGQEQSPVDIPSETSDVDLAELAIDWGQVDLSFEDTGYGMKGTPAGSPSAMIGDDPLTLLQFHPHAPSEHTIAGESFPAEVHFVHQTPDGNLAVVGILLEEGEANPAMQSLVDAMESGSASGVELASLLPESKEYHTYAGSLTTPPCSEGVRWIVMKEPVTASAEQIEAVAGGYGDTNRPVQPLGEREVRSE